MRSGRYPCRLAFAPALRSWTSFPARLFVSAASRGAFDMRDVCPKHLPIGQPGQKRRRFTGIWQGKTTKISSPEARLPTPPDLHGRGPFATLSTGKVVAEDHCPVPDLVPMLKYTRAQADVSCLQSKSVGSSSTRVLFGRCLWIETVPMIFGTVPLQRVSAGQLKLAQISTQM